MNEDAADDGLALFAKFRAIDEATRAGDMDALRAALDDPLMFPDCTLPPELGMGEHILHHAVNFAPVEFIGALVALGANVNHQPQDGFPALIAAISGDRPEKHAIVELLLAHRADPNIRGYNDWTPLHLAVNIRDLESVRLLIGQGADVTLKTRTDEETTALEDARVIGFTEAMALIEAALPGQG